MNPADAFLEMLIAAMKDAAMEGKLTQLKTQLDADGTGRLRVIRIVVIPEKMEHNWPTFAPLGTPTKEN